MQTYNDMKLSILNEEASTVESIGVFIKLPEDLAKQYQQMKEDPSPPHITVLYIGDVDVEQKAKAIKTIKEIVAAYDPIDVWVDGLAYFTNPKGEEIAHSMVEAKTLAALSKDLWDELLRIGIKVQHSFPDYTPHVTLQYGDKRNYDGPVPKGNFNCKEVEIWAKDAKKIGVAKFG